MHLFRKNCLFVPEMTKQFGNMELTKKYLEKHLRKQSSCNTFLNQSCCNHFLDSNISPGFEKDNLIEVYKFSDLYYNKELNLDHGILTDEKFKDKVFVHYQELELLFPLYNFKSQLSGFISQDKSNNDYLSELSGKEKKSSVWFSNFQDKPIQTLFITSDPVEAINHYKFNYDDLRESNILYIATGERIYIEQLELIDKFISGHEIDNIVSIFDDNIGGLSLTAFLSGSLNSIKKASSELTLFDSSNLFTYPVSLPVELHLWFEGAKDTSACFKPLNDYNAYLKGEFTISYIDESKVEVLFPKACKLHWQVVLEFLNQFNEVKITNQLPLFGSFIKDIKKFKR